MYVIDNREWIAGQGCVSLQHVLISAEHTPIRHIVGHNMHIMAVSVSTDNASTMLYYVRRCGLNASHLKIVFVLFHPHLSDVIVFIDCM
jgi:hypothetical protein